MSAFTSLEQTALAAVLDEMIEERGIVQEQLLHAIVLSRENTGGGFFTEIEIGHSACELDRQSGPLGYNVFIGVDGLEFGLGMILHLKEGRASLLEGYAVAPENTLAIDFAHVRFELIGGPGPLPLKGS